MMIKDFYNDFCKQVGIELNEQEYEAFYAGWMSCRSVALSIIESLDDQQDQEIEH